MPSDPTITVIFIEISLILLIFLSILIFGILHKKRKLSKLLTAMLKRNMDNREDRRRALIASFSSLPHINENAIEDIAAEIIDREILFYEYISSAIIDMKSRSIDDISDEVMKLVAPYERLSSKNKTEADKINIDRQASENMSPDFDDALDDLLSDDNSSTQNNPEFDLSATNHESESDEAVSENILDIAEIPEELLSADANDSKNGTK